ncbi:hypothetical protein MKZ17_17355 [Solibacillus sp. FSL R7-0682]|uniref:hypothetical protein n=1 Tax=Solibacillus sp. FSL R7-0682 TaxID=2921690 RepID=UPI0030FA073D
MKKLTYFDGEKLRKVIEGQNDVEHIDFKAESKIAKVNYEGGTVVTITSPYMKMTESFDVEASIKFLSGIDF